MMVLVAACGGGGSKSAKKAIVAASSTTTSPQRFVRGVEQCGSIVKGAGPAEISAGEPDPEACFTDAVDACTAATMVYSSHGVDTGVAHRFVVTPHGNGCTITDSVLTITALRNLHPQAKDVTCAKVERDAQGLHARACGEFGDVTVPAVK